jgi:hypothetical protein
MRDGELVEYAGELAPHVDRLFIAVHRAARPFAESVLGELRALRLGFLIDLRKLTLAPHGMTVEQALAFERYIDAAHLLAALDENQRQGMIARRGVTFQPTATGRRILLAITEAQAKAAVQLWSGLEPNMPDVIQSLHRVVDHAAQTLDRSHYPVFTSERLGYLPADPAPAYMLFTHISTLRYLRADAHALAWREAGLTASQAVCVATLLKEPEQIKQLERFEHHAEALESLNHKGWISRERAHWKLTKYGRETRESIERATNQHNGAPFGALTQTERSALLDTLMRFPA